MKQSPIFEVIKCESCGLPRAEYERLTVDPIRRFHNICDRIGRNAKERGLTDELFDEIMAKGDE